MAFSFTATIRAFVAPKCRLSCSRGRWRGIVTELARRGQDSHESGVFLLGIEQAGCKKVLDSVFYDDLDPEAYETGVCVLQGDAFAKLWAICREKNLTVVADVHTHGGKAFQSGSDKTNPMVAREGHIAIILPDFARSPISLGRIGIYEYDGDHAWFDRGGVNAHRYFYIGLWG